MIQPTDSDFQTVCEAGGVQERILAIESRRRAALLEAWLRGAAGLVVSVAALVILQRTGFEVVAMLMFAGLLFGTYMAATGPLAATKDGLKHPVLEEVANKAGMEYLPAGFKPPAFAAASGLLFGAGAYSMQNFTDLFKGTDREGRGFAVYEASLQRRMGGHTQGLFRGQMYAVQRRPGRQGHVAILPDRKIFNFWKPASDMERVRIEGDPAFEKSFEVYATHAAEARALLADPAWRAALVKRGNVGGLLIYAGPTEALVAIEGQDRFEPGSMLRSRSGRQRARRMFNEVCVSLDLLRQVKAKLE